MVHVRLVDDLLNLLLGHALPAEPHHQRQLPPVDVAIAILNRESKTRYNSLDLTDIVKHFEGLSDFLLLILILHLQLHHHQKLGEVNGSAAIFVNCIYQILNQRKLGLNK